MGFSLLLLLLLLLFGIRVGQYFQIAERGPRVKERITDYGLLDLDGT